MLFGKYLISSDNKNYRYLDKGLTKVWLSLQMQAGLIMYSAFTRSLRVD